MTNLTETNDIIAPTVGRDGFKSMDADSSNTALRQKKRGRKSAWSLPRDRVGKLRWAIAAYLILWLIEGGLRRWFLPGLEKPLLVVRDPVALGIYWMAIQSRLFPKNGFMVTIFILAPISFLMAIVTGHQNAIVGAYGVRCDFFHVPLIFVMARVLTLQDLDRWCRVALWVSIPYTILLAMQFYSPQSAWVNRGLGGDLGGAGFSGALDKFRPPGTFSFITGPTMLYPMFAAAWFHLFGRRKLGFLLMVASGIAIVMAIPLSISRALLFGVLIVACGGVVVLVRTGVVSGKSLGQVIAGGMLVIAAAWWIQISTDAFDAFGARWENSTTNRGGVEEAIVGRAWDGMVGPFAAMPAIGYGTGISTQVGQKVATGTRGFGYSEGEWGRILLEGGIIVGIPILIFRLSLVLYLMLSVATAVRRKRLWSLPFLAAALPLMLQGQWGQATALGASIIAAGVCCAAAKPTSDLPHSRKRRRKDTPLMTETVQP